MSHNIELTGVENIRLCKWCGQSLLTIRPVSKPGYHDKCYKQKINMAWISKRAKYNYKVE